ncbi:HAD family hydrolase, partial [Bacteroidota bacterium]
NPESENFIAIPDRIATFDNDGTLWSEKPYAFQMYFCMNMIKAMAPEHPEWKNDTTLSAILDNDPDEVIKQGWDAIVKMILTSEAGKSTEEVNEDVKKWIRTARHPRFNKPFTDLVYQPMLELLRYLQENDFKTFIVSGGGIEFMRAWVEKVYGIPRDQVIGTYFAAKFEIVDGEALVINLPKIEFVDNKEGKPIGISRFIGRRPVFSAGNSDDDLAMMEYTATGDGARFMMYVHHTDSVREWAYDRNTKMGQLDKGLDAAHENGWTVADMKNDWKVIYPFEEAK